jgi:glycosyltransferase involved in cell wall biosynthesis
MLWILIIPVLPYFFLLLFICRNLISIRVYRNNFKPGLKASVVVACKNEEKNLPLILGDLYSQDYPPELFEVIIVDDNSTDTTFEIASEYKQFKSLKVIRNNGKGKKSAIRTGIEAADNEIIMTTDADCRLRKDWIRNIATFYEENKPDLLIGPVMLEDKPGFFNKFQELEFLSLQGITAGTAAAGNPVMCNGANLSFTKKTYYKHSHNLHDEIASGDDIFFLQSLKKDTGVKIMWLNVEDSTVITDPAKSAGSFIRQRARWISKAKAYDDSYTTLLAIVTFVTILDMICLFIAGIFSPSFLVLFAILISIKSIPDLIILVVTARRYGNPGLLFWFLPAQIVYPFYVVAVTVFAITGKSKWKKDN